MVWYSMMNLKLRLVAALGSALWLALASEGRAQSLGNQLIAPAGAARLAEKPAPGVASDDPEAAKFKYFETLGEKGWDIPRPGTRESVTADVGGIRSKLAEYGIGFLGLGTYTIAQDGLHRSGGVQYYNGQRPTFNSSTQFSVSLNLAQYGIQNAQITGTMAAQATSWRPLGPRATSLVRLWYYQTFLDGRFAVKVGYIVQPVEFFGTAIGGNIVSGTLGPNANLLFQAGIARSPLTAPGANFRYNGPNHLYVKSAIQRSLSPAGAQVEHDENPTGFRFRTPNTRPLFINEFGYNRPASPSENMIWLRGGGIYNTSPYTVFGTPRTSTNYAFFALADAQLIKTDRDFPARGIYGGVSFIGGDKRVDATSSYWEGRVYGVGLVPGRPADFVSLVYTATNFSDRQQSVLRAQGIPTFPVINNVTASYSARLVRGTFLVNGITYGDHAAASVVGRPALVLSSTLSIVF